MAFYHDPARDLIRLAATFLSAQQYHIVHVTVPTCHYACHEVVQACTDVVLALSRHRFGFGLALAAFAACKIGIGCRPSAETTSFGRWHSIRLHMPAYFVTFVVHIQTDNPKKTHGIDPCVTVVMDRRTDFKNTSPANNSMINFSWLVVWLGMAWGPCSHTL